MAAVTWITRVAKRATFFRPGETKKLLHLGAMPDALREFRVSSIELLLLLLRVSVLDTSYSLTVVAVVFNGF